MYHNVTVHSHVYKAAEQHTRCTDRCNMQIKSPVVCDVNKAIYTTLTNLSTIYLVLCKVYTDVGGIK